MSDVVNVPLACYFLFDEIHRLALARAGLTTMAAMTASDGDIAVTSAGMITSMP